MWQSMSARTTIGFGAVLLITLYTARLILNSRKNKRKIKRIIDTLSRNKFSKSPAIGIDLGTALSRVAVFQDDSVIVLSDKQGVNVLPSFVSFTDSEALIGEAARALVIANATNTVYDLKLLLGRQLHDPWIQHYKSSLPFTLIESNNQLKVQIEHKKRKSSLNPEHLVSMLLAQLKENAEHALGLPVYDAVLIVPQFFNDAQRQAMLNAGILAGLNVQQIVNETSAAAIAFKFMNQNKISTNGQIFVFHLGAGSCSASVIVMKENGLAVKAAVGSYKVSGREFDNKMVDFFVSEFKNRFNQDISTNKKALQRLRFASERAKRILSTSIIANIEITSILPDTDFYFSLTRNEFEHITRELCEEISSVIDAALGEAKILKFEIDHVLLTGGATKIPKIHQILSSYFVNKDFEIGVDPDEAVVCGAALQAAILRGDYMDKSPFLHLLDVTPLSLGIETVGGIMTVLIPRNSTLPAKKKQIFTTYQDNQYSILVQVYEGERSLARDNNLLGKFKLSDIPAMPRGIPQILVTFDVDVNGILTVSASEITSGTRSNITITRNNNLISRGEIASSLQEAEKHRLQDEETCRNIEAKIAMENYLFRVKSTLESCDFVSNVKIHEMERYKLLEQCNDALQWLSLNPSASKDELNTKLDLLEGTFTPVLFNIARSKESLRAFSETFDENSNSMNIKLCSFERLE